MNAYEQLRLKQLFRDVAELKRNILKRPRDFEIQKNIFSKVKRVPSQMKAADVKEGEVLLVDDEINGRAYIMTRVRGELKYGHLNNDDASIAFGSSTVPVIYGGTGGSTKSVAFANLSPMTTLGDIIYGATSGVGTRLTGNTTTTKKFLTQTGDGVASAAPAWAVIDITDIQDAVADGSTKGVASFDADDFDDDGSGIISIDYENGQEAASGQKGFLTGDDWDTFNGKQDQDADLDAIAALSSTGLLSRTGAGAYSERTITGTSNQINVANGDGVSGNPTLSLQDNVKFIYKKTFAYSDAGSAFNVISLPENAVIWSIKVNITTLFNGSGTDLLDIGVTGEGNRYKDDLDIASTGWSDADTNLPDKMSGTTQVTAEYTDENADASAGVGEIYVEYSLF